MKRFQKGFTIIEITIVIAVISVIATFIYISLTNVAQGARDSAREKDTNAWTAAFDDYKARFTVWPLLPASSLLPKTVCLGTFTNSKCGQNNSSTPTQFISASGTDYTSLQTEIQRVGNLYTNTGSAINGVLAGPIVYISRSADSGTIPVMAQFINFFESSCPSGYTNINTSLPPSIALVLSGQTANACAVTKTFSYTPS